MLEISKKTNLLEQKSYKYSLQDVAEPNLYRDIYPYTEPPKIPFNHRRVPMGMPADIFITDTSFRDGQQSVEPYTVNQIVDLYKMLSRLGGPKGIIRQTEFFVYSQKDREAVRRCQDLGYRFPEITTWIRATKEDFKLVKDLGIQETGILVSSSDYHIFKKLGLTRKQAMEKYLATVSMALEAGIRPRCHLEDVTRADFYGFVVPFVNELMALGRQAGIPIKIRVCDTMGYGVPYTEVALPRSVPGIVYGLQHYSDVPSECMEWHGHNDFYKAVPNATAAWLYGCGAVNCSMLGIGERTGNIPLEAMVFEYADGLLKDEEIYNIFDTKTILDRPATVTIGKTSGLAGIAYWINENYDLRGDKAVDKHSPLVVYLKNWVDREYGGGRENMISPDEMERKIDEFTGGWKAQL